LQSHYNYVFDEITNTYNFVTKNEILYRIAFIIDETFSTISGEEISNIFQLIVEKSNDEIEPYDSKVSKTIEHLIERFFQKIENSLIYICSDDNEKAEKRHEIFNRWYKKSKYKVVIIKIDNIISVTISENEKQKLYTSFMFHKQNSNFEKLLEIYSQLEKVLNEEK
jgi:hypothetical protein